MLLGFKPLLRKKLDYQRKQKQQALFEMPPSYETDTDKNIVFNKILTEFNFQFRHIVDNSTENILKPEWYLRSKLSEIIFEH